MVIKNKIRNIIRESIKKVLVEGFLDDIYLSDNFKRWFNGSKIVDENGKPLLLGHGTMSFHSIYKSKRFNTNFIHLASIDDASYFAGGKKRMFRFKNTINKLSDEDIINLYNKYLKYGSDGFIYLLDDEGIKKYNDKYNIKMAEMNQESKYYSLEKREKIRILLDISKNALLKHYQRNFGKLAYREVYEGSGPKIAPGYLDAEKCINDKREIKKWLEFFYPTLKQVRNSVIGKMFSKDNYFGNGGTYPLCARVLNPLTIDCHGNIWSQIYVRPDNCDAYEALFDKYCEFGGNKNGLKKGSWFELDNESIAYLAKKLGYDGVIFHNIREGADGEYRMKTTYIVYSTKQLKSPFENNGEFGDIENLFK